MTLARLVFNIAGVYGLLVLPPLYFLEERIGRDRGDLVFGVLFAIAYGRTRAGEPTRARV
jgi:hypothetical protein